MWTALYLAIALAGWLWWREGEMATTVMWWWSAQLALNLAWSAVFFGLHRPLWALITIVALDAAILATVLVGWEVRRAASVALAALLGVDGLRHRAERRDRLVELSTERGVPLPVARQNSCGCVGAGAAGGASRDASAWCRRWLAPAIAAVAAVTRPETCRPMRRRASGAA